MSDRRELHGRIAESLGWKPIQHANLVWHEPTCMWALGNVQWSGDPQRDSCSSRLCSLDGPPFYDTDEAANARLLEAMPFATLQHYSGRKGHVNSDDPFWYCSAGDIEAEHSDRKIAIVDAYAKWKQLA